MIKFIRVFVLSLSLGALLCYVGSASAESSSVVGGSASVRLDFAIDIPSVLFLQVGTAGATIDTVTFGVTNVPGTGAVAGTSSGANPVPVQVSGIVGAGATITLTADSLTPLTDGANTIPFDEISWAAGGAFSGGTFTNNAAQQLDQFTGSGDRIGDYSFSYDNDTYYPAGVYAGSVTYTLSSP